MKKSRVPKSVVAAVIDVLEVRDRHPSDPSQVVARLWPRCWRDRRPQPLGSWRRGWGVIAGHRRLKRTQGVICSTSFHQATGGTSPARAFHSVSAWRRQTESTCQHRRGEGDLSGPESDRTSQEVAQNVHRDAAVPDSSVRRKGPFPFSTACSVYTDYRTAFATNPRM